MATICLILTLSRVIMAKSVFFFINAIKDRGIFWGFRLNTREWKEGREVNKYLVISITLMPNQAEKPKNPPGVWAPHAIVFRISVNARKTLRSHFIK